MQINLASTLDNLKLITSVAGDIQYKINYTDITSAGVSNPSVSRGIITTATTTTILIAPAALTTRKIQSIHIYNNGAPNTLTLEDSVSGTDNIYFSISLGTKEFIRCVNDDFNVYDVSGRVKQQNTGDSELAGESRSIFKIGTAPEAAGQYYSFAKDSGFPGAWSPGTPGINGRNTNGTSTLDFGCIALSNPASGSWYLRDFNISSTVVGQFILSDFLWVNSGISVTSVGTQTITQAALPPRDNLGSTLGSGIQVGILVTTATTNASPITNMTVMYTNSDGVPNRTATLASFPATAVVGTFVKFQLQAGDRGVRLIESITLGTSLVSGAISLVCFNELASSSILLINAGNLAFPRKLDLLLYPDHCLIPLFLASSTVAATISGNIYFINK